MHIFLTGATGYIGSAVLDSMIKGGHQVTAIARDPEKAERLMARARRRIAELRERDARIARDEQARVPHGEDGGDRVGETLVRPDHARREDGSSIVRALRIAPEHRVRDHAELAGRDTEGDERPAAALGVDDDAVEPCGRGAARDAFAERCGAAGDRAR